MERIINPFNPQQKQNSPTKRMGRSITQEDVDLLESITDEEIDPDEWDSRYTNCRYGYANTQGS